VMPDGSFSYSIFSDMEKVFILSQSELTLSTERIRTLTMPK
jgi:hypothetical protein